MRIITWNCNKGFKQKIKAISKYSPDIVILQECENINDIELVDDIQPSYKYQFQGNNTVGIGILCYKNFNIRPFMVTETYVEDNVGIPFIIDGPKTFQILSVWTGGNEDKNKDYLNALNSFLKKNKDWVFQNDTFIMGDFNSNLIYNKKEQQIHREMLNLMTELGLCSAYHHYFQDEQGKEKQPTFYFHKKKESPFHMDFIFIPEKLKDKIKKIEVGIFDDWHTYSDHMPVIMDIDYP